MIVVRHMCTFVKIHQNVHLNLAHLSVCKVHFNKTVGVFKYTDGRCPGAFYYRCAMDSHGVGAGRREGGCGMASDRIHTKVTI